MTTPAAPAPLPAELAGHLTAAARRWRDIARTAGPADRTAAELGVRRAYRNAGLPEPEAIVWLASPAQGALAAALLVGDANTVRTFHEVGLTAYIGPVLTALTPRTPGDPTSEPPSTLTPPHSSSASPGNAPNPIAAPGTVAALETVATPDTVAAPDPIAAPGIIAALETVAAPGTVAALDPIAAPLTVAAPGAVAASGAVAAPNTTAAPGTVAPATTADPDILVAQLNDLRAIAGASVRHAVRNLPWERARAAAATSLGTVAWPRAWALTGDLLWPEVNTLAADLRRAIGNLPQSATTGDTYSAPRVDGRDTDDDAAALLREQAGSLLRQATLDAVLGQHEAPWLALFDGLTAHATAGPDGGTGAPGSSMGSLDGLAQVAKAAGWWWPFERLAIVCERPADLHLDDLGRLHRADGPAMGFPDGFALHAWHGMPVPASFGVAMAGLDAKRIQAEENAELRRVMLEHYGYERYLAESGAKPTHEDETGVLWRIDLADDEPVVMVEVVNSTPEPDGTSRTYFLRVPPWVTRAREGVAWTFGVSEQDYQPEKQT